jgi:NAD+ diphosphatase
MHPYLAKRFTKALPPAEQNTLAYWFIFKDNLLLVNENAGKVSIPLLPAITGLGEVLRQQYLGLWEEKHCYSVELASATEAPPGMRWAGLRQLYGLLPDVFFSLAGEAIQIMDWDRTHQFCGRCGAATVNVANEFSKKCPACGLTSYPRISPAVIVLIEHGNKVLLSRSPHFPKGMYSIQAGFVEPGENLEQAVKREILEEVGIHIKQVKYFGSQPWPFPNSLMIGFTARYAGGELTIDKVEIEEAAWYGIDELPEIPPPLSIARKLIDHFVKKQTKQIGLKQMI